MLYDFIQGPLIWVAVVVFVVGVVFQVIQFFTLTKRKEQVFFDLAIPTGDAKKKKHWWEKYWWQVIIEWFHSLRKTVWRTHTSVMVMTSLFHFFLVVTPFFVLGHNILLDQALGIRFLSVPEFMTDALTVVVFLCVAFFLYRRLFLARVRAITTGYDYLMLLVTLAPFLTGYFAYHQWFDYSTVIFLHILSGEVMLITIPFTKLGHMIFFFLYRFLIGSEYSFSQGSRTW
jgi:nitrate reductase gamma subunit